MKMPTRYTKTCIPQYCRYHTEWPKEAFLPAQFQGVQKRHVDALQDIVGVQHARDVAQDQQYLVGDGQRPAVGQLSRQRGEAETPTSNQPPRVDQGRRMLGLIFLQMPLNLLLTQKVLKELGVVFIRSSRQQI